MFRPVTDANERLLTVYRECVEPGHSPCTGYGQRVAALFTACAQVERAASEVDLAVSALRSVQHGEQPDVESEHIGRDLITQLGAVEDVLKHVKIAPVITRVLLPPHSPMSLDSFAC